MKYTLEILPDDLVVGKLPADEKIGFPQTQQGNLFALIYENDVITIICPEKFVPKNAVSELGWRALKVLGILDFSLVGILAEITSVLANAGISIFAISTYQTDYILLKKENISKAIVALQEADYKVIET